MRQAGILVLICVFLGAAPVSTAAETGGETRPADAVERLSDELLASPPEGMTRADVALALGWLHLFDVFGAPDPERAVSLLKIALDAGLAEAGVVLGAVYIGQEEVAADLRDIPLALSYYEKAAAAGSVDAMRMLGILYADGGEGVKPDPEKSRRYLLDAAARGSEMALKRLEPLIAEAAAWEREHPGREADFPSTREELVDPSLSEEARRRAAQVTETTARILDLLTARIEEDNAAALSRAGAGAARTGQDELWAKVEKAIDDGAMEIVDGQPDDKRRGEAALVIGVLHYMGLLHGQDMEKARRFLEIALEHGVPEARVTLGELYLGLTRDDETAARDVAKGMAYLDEAAEGDSVDALRLLGIVYTEGVEGVPADPGKAEKYFLAAARHGDFESLERLEPLFARAAEWEREHPGETSPLPTGPESVIVPELAEKARLRGEEISAMVEKVNAEFEEKVKRAVRGGDGSRAD